jgi:hypothetical protein
MADSPRTREELETWMKSNCYNFNEYAVNGNHIHEGFGIDTVDGRFRWYYTERGEKSSIMQFQSEAEIVTYAFEQIKSDTWAQAHCIGFTADKNDVKELRNILEAADVEFLQDEIPNFYGDDRSVYRIFVLGCEIQKTGYLKERYYKS